MDDKTKMKEENDNRNMDDWENDLTTAYMAGKYDGVEDTRKLFDTVLNLLAEWCVAVTDKGSGWDDWDECYKNACWRHHPARGHIDLKMQEIREKNHE